MTIGDSGTPLAKKLGMKEGSIVVSINAPDDYPELIAPLPDGVTFTDNIGNADLIHLFTNSRDELFYPWRASNRRSNQLLGSGSRGTKKPQNARQRSRKTPSAKPPCR